MFSDTNLRAYRLDQREPDKAERLKPWMAVVTAAHGIVICTRMLIEWWSVARRKLQPPISASHVTDLVDAHPWMTF